MSVTVEKDQKRPVGRPRKPELGRPYAVRLPADVLRGLDRVCKSRHDYPDRSQLIREILIDFLEDENEL